MSDPLVLTLIAAEDGRADLPAVVASCAERLALGAPPLWLAPELACDLPVAGAVPSAEAEAIGRRAIGTAAIDIVVQPQAGRRKRLLVADMESTMIENEMLDELADFLGLRAPVSEITRRAMNGEIDFAAALRERVALLQGMPAAMLDTAASRIRIMPGASALVATMRRHGALTALVSGGFAVFAERVAAQLGFERVIANTLDLADGAIAGTVRPPIVTGETKHRTLLDLATSHGVPVAATMAVGDGANDLPMLQAAGLGVAFRAKPAVAAAARCRIDHADLTALLFAQGYREEEIVG